ncbi:hypothetical protein E3N88_12534 [Mikania micrantha]|uniref:Uncharacterized protein n=1 Tax=Mikania micrantha TaxID=192012 RepID=A0A5N6P5S9_9ASTR|nr:hypothetical protein E3N88_12534 [Mikania micrantha]
MNSSIFRRSFSLNTSKTKSTLHQDLESEETTFSILGGEKLYINKILSRDSSLDRSSRIYYRSNTNIGVPFQWEKKPGTPMNPPREEVIQQQTPPLPPPPPPPAFQSLELPRPNVDMKDSSLSGRFWLWRRRLSKKMRIQMYDQRGCHTKLSGNLKGNKVSSSDGDLDAELVGWIHGDSKSLSSSSICLSNDQFESFRKGIPFCCTTWRRYKGNNK